MNKQTISSVLRFLSVALAGIGAILMAVAMCRDFGAASNYFRAGALLPTLSVIASLLSASVGILSSCLTPKAVLAKVTPFARPIGSFPATVGFIAGGLLLLFSSSVLTERTQDMTRSFFYITAILFFVSAIYSYLSSSALAKKHPAAIAVLGFFALAACASANVYCYFDVSVEMNAPFKVSLQTAYLFSMLYYTGELRYLLMRQKPRFYLILSHLTLAACATAAFSIPAAYFFGSFVRADYHALSVAALGLFITTLLRILGVFQACAAETAPSEPTAADKPTDTPTNDPAPAPSASDLADSDDEQKETDEE